MGLNGIEELWQQEEIWRERVAKERRRERQAEEEQFVSASPRSDSHGASLNRDSSRSRRVNLSVTQKKVLREK